MCKNRFVRVEVNSQGQKEKKKDGKLACLFTFHVFTTLPLSAVTITST
jgi:hypothetical protein